MSKPATKTQLITQSEKEYTALEQFLSALTPEQMQRPGALGEWAVKDVIAHLLEWQHMFCDWYETGLRGETPAVPAPGYKWSELPALNQAIYERCRAQPLDDILARFRASHRQTMQLIDALDEETLFTPGLYPWMRANKLAAYFTSITSSHYRWARTEMRKGLKSR